MTNIVKLNKKKYFTILLLILTITLLSFFMKLDMLKEKLAYLCYEKANKLSSWEESDLAVFFYKKAINIDPDNYIFYYGLAKEEYKQKRMNNSKNYFKEVLNKNPDKKIKADSYTNIISIYIFEEEYESAIKFSIDLIEKENDIYLEKYAHLMIGMCYTLMGNKDMALISLTQANEVSLFDNEKDELFERIKFTTNFIYEFSFSKNYDNLIEKIKKSKLTINEKNDLLSQIYYELQEYDKVINLVNDSARNINDLSFLLMLGSSLLQENRIEEAKEIFLNLLFESHRQENIKSTKKSINLMGAYLGLGEYSSKKENYDEALSYFLKGLDLFPEKEKINNYYNKINFYRFSIMHNYKIAEIYIVKNEPEKISIYLEKINEIKKDISDEMWNKINNNYWPKKENITLDEKIINLKNYTVER